MIPKERIVVYDAVCKWAQKRLLENKKFIEKLTENHIRHHHIKEFGLGYFEPGPESVQNLLSYLRIPLETLISLFIVSVDENNIAWSPFEHRIIFPIKDITQATIGVGGKRIARNDFRVNYYVLPETDFNPDSFFGTEKLNEIFYELDRPLEVDNKTRKKVRKN